MTRNVATTVRVDFSLRREIFFVVIGAIIGALAMIVSITFFDVGRGLPYYLTWIAFGHVVGVYSSASVIAGVAIHMITAISIGIGIGIFLYKTGMLNISKLSNGVLYGLFAGSVVFVAFFLPVYEFILAPEIARTLSVMEPTTEVQYPEYAAYSGQQTGNNVPVIMVGWIAIHLVFGVS